MDVKKLIVACLGLVAFWFLVVAPAEAGEAKVIKSKASGSFVSANFDFDHPDLSTPANSTNGVGRSNAGQITSQGANEYTPDLNMKTCTVPGGTPNAGTEYKLVQDVDVSRFENGDLLFLKSTSGTACQDFSTFPSPPFPFTFTETGIVTGGTGKFSGATGTYTGTGNGATLFLDATGERVFGWFKSTFVTTVTVPDSH